MWFPASPGWSQVVVVRSPAAPLRALPPLPLGSVALRAAPLVSFPGLPGLWWVCGGVGFGGGGLDVGLGPFPWRFPLGGFDDCTPRQRVTLLYGPSICTRSVRMDLHRGHVLQPFPTPGSGTLWVAGESLRNRRVSCLLGWTVCPTCSSSLDTNRSTCRGECSWSGSLVTPLGRCHLRPLTNGPGRISPYCVCSGGAHMVTEGAPKPLRLGPWPAAPVGSFCPVPALPLCWVRWWVFRHSWLRCGGGARGGRPLTTPALPASSGWGPLPVVVGGPSPLLAEDPGCGSPPLLAWVRWWCWGGGPSPLLTEVRWFVGRG